MNILALLLAAQSIDIVEQHIDVDVTGSELSAIIDVSVVVDGYDAMPIYGLAAAVTEVKVDDLDALLENDTQYGALVQWLAIPGNPRSPGAASPGGAEHHVHIVLSGAPSCRSALYQGMDACTFRSDEIALLPGQPGASWYLSNLIEVDPFVGSVTVRAPIDHFVASGQGSALDVVDLGDGSARSTFDIVVPTEMLGVLSRRVETARAETEDGRVVLAGAPSADALEPMQRVANTAAAVWPRYESMFGALPVDEVHFLPVSGRFPFGGMGLLGDIFLGDFITTPRFDYLIEQGAAHELAHSWWGGMASATDPAAGGFLQEALAEYSAWRALGADDDAVRTAGARMNAVWYMTQIVDDVAILGAGDDPDAYVLVTYHKGSTVVRTLAESVGEDVFTEALAAVVARGPTELSVDAILEESGVDPALADQWLRRPGYPKVGIQVSADHVTLTEENGFDVAVPIRAVAADGATQELVIRAGDTPLALSPVLVEVDPRWTMVREVIPALHGDVSCDGRVDAFDLMEIALRHGGRIPDERRQDGSYDPLYDVNDDGRIDEADMDSLL